MKKTIAAWLLRYLQRPEHWNVGDKFTVVEWLESNDKSWIGEICTIQSIDGDMITFTSGKINMPGYRAYRIGIEFNIKPLCT